MDELLDILDESGLPTGEVVPKSEAHRLGLWHRCFHCWICGSDPGGSYLLLQRRAATKDTWPGYLDVTAAGHLAAGEETLDGLREVEEELGLRIEREARPARSPQGGAGDTCRLRQGAARVFLVFDATPPGDLSLQKEEVEAVFRLDLDDVEALYEKGSAPAREYAEGSSSATRIHLAEFVPKKKATCAE